MGQIDIMVNEEFIGKRVAIKDFHGNSLCADSPVGKFGTRSSVGPWETFSIERNPKGGVAIKTSHGKYLRMNDNGDGSKVDCGSNTKDDWEQIDIIKVPVHDRFQPKGGYALRSGFHANSYVRSWPENMEENHHKFGHCDVAGRRERFEVFQINIEDNRNEEFIGKRITIKIPNNDKPFVSAQGNGSVQTRSTPDLWETFTIEEHPAKNGAVTIKSHHGGYMSIPPKEGMNGVVFEPKPYGFGRTDWEQIDIIKVNGGYALRRRGVSDRYMYVHASNAKFSSVLVVRPSMQVGAKLGPIYYEKTFQLDVEKNMNEKFLNKQVTIRDYHKKFLCAEDVNKSFAFGTRNEACLDPARSYELFTIVQHPTKTDAVAIKTKWGKYWRMYNNHGKVDCGADKVDNWEQIDIIEVAEGQYALKSRYHPNSYVRSNKVSQPKEANCDVAKARSTWETFQIAEVPTQRRRRLQQLTARLDSSCQM